MRILGLDYGSKTVGVAVSDELMMTAQGVETIVRKEENKLRKTLARIVELISEYGVDTVVVGLPLNMDDTEGERAKKTREFGELVEKRTGLPVMYQDERLTTFAADEVLDERGVPGYKRKADVDRVAACFILEDYMKSLGQDDGRKEYTYHGGQ